MLYVANAITIPMRPVLIKEILSWVVVAVAVVAVAVAGGVVSTMGDMGGVAL